MVDFRQRLKRETSAAHDRVDAGYGCLDVSNRADLTIFLRGQYLGHVLVQNSYAQKHRFGALGERIEAMVSDLRVLGGNTAPPTSDYKAKYVNKSTYTSLGLTYVIAGSLHGTNVLKKTWEKSTDSTVLSAHHFMTFSNLKSEWADVLSVLKNKSFTVDEELQIIRSANYAFDLFETGLRSALDAG